MWYAGESTGSCCPSLVAAPTAGGIASGCVVGFGGVWTCSASAEVVVVTGGRVSAREGARGALVSFPMMLLVVVVVWVAVVLERWRACFALGFGLPTCSAVAAVPAPPLPARE